MPGGKAIDFGLLMQGMFAFQRCWFGLAWIGSDWACIHKPTHAMPWVGYYVLTFSASSSWAGGRQPLTEKSGDPLKLRPKVRRHPCNRWDCRVRTRLNSISVPGACLIQYGSIRLIVSVSVPRSQSRSLLLLSQAWSSLESNNIPFNPPYYSIFRLIHSTIPLFLHRTY